MPKAPRIAFTCGHGFNDVARIWDARDRVWGKHPGMVLLHGGSPKGAS